MGSDRLICKIFTADSIANCRKEDQNRNRKNHYCMSYLVDIISAHLPTSFQERSALVRVVVKHVYGSAVLRYGL